MRVVAVKTLREFWTRYRDAEELLKAWYAEAAVSQWRTPQDVRARFRSADVLGGNRIVFNTKGNQYRLVAKIHYNTGIVYIRFVGTHTEYDGIDAETI